MDRGAPFVLLGIGLAIAGAAYLLLAGPTPAGEHSGGALSPTEAASSVGEPRLSTPPSKIESADKAATDSSQPQVVRATSAPEQSEPGRLPQVNEARISGFVKLASRPIAGARIAAIDANGLEIATVQSEVDGAWALFVPPSIGFTLRASYPKAVPYQRSELPLAERATRLAGNLTLAAGRDVQGTVFDESGLPVPGSWAAVASQSYSAAELAQSIDDMGTFTIQNAPLQAQIEVGAPGYQFDTRTLSSNQSQELVLRPGRSIEISVQDQSGAPIEGANVLFIPADRSSGQHETQPIQLDPNRARPAAGSAASRHSVLTNKVGWAHTNQLGMGLYWAEISHEDYATGLPIKVPTAKEAQLVPPNLVATLERLPRLHFRVESVTGAALPKEVFASYTYWNEARQIHVEVNPTRGIIDVVVARAKSFEISAWSPGTHVAKLTAGPFESDTLTLELQPANMVPLRIVDVRGAAIPGATYQVYMAVKSQILGGEAASLLELDGRYWPGSKQIQAAAEDNLVQDFRGEDWPFLVIEAPGFQTTRLPYSKFPERSAEGVLVVELQRSATLKVTVLDEQGRPVPAALIYFTVDGKPLAESLSTDELGIGLQAGLAGTQISLMARGPSGQLTERKEVELALGGTSEVTLTLR